jgi:hypothetical protein
MSETKMSKKNGQCLCGKVKVSANKASNHVGVCHCSFCRKRTGGPLFALDCGTEVSFHGKDNISVYNSSEWAERGFCKQCGSNLFYRLKEKQHYFIPAGLFEDDKEFVFDHEVFVDEKPKYYDFKNETSKMTGAEVFAKFT